MENVETSPLSISSPLSSTCSTPVIFPVNLLITLVISFRSLHVVAITKIEILQVRKTGLIDAKSGNESCGALGEQKLRFLP